MSAYWPNGKKFALCLTHDVDRVRKSYQYMTHFIKSKNWYHIKSFLNRKSEPYWNFEKIMNLEKKDNVRSTFFFLEESKKLDIFHPSKWPLSLGKYKFSDEKVAEIISKLHSGGWEIGLHGSYDSYKNKDLLRLEKKKLEDVLGDEVIGIRQHYLNLEIPYTWKIQKEFGFKYDASFGFSKDIGFRENKILPFRPFNDYFLVIPLTIMDAALFYKFPEPKKAWRKLLEIFDFAEKHGALVTVLWHQRVFNENEFPQWSKMYERIIQEGKKRDAWFARCRDVWGVYKDEC